MPLYATAGFRLVRAGPYCARSASDRTDDWPYWFVAGGDGINAMAGPGGAVLTSREIAERIAAEASGKDEI